MGKHFVERLVGVVQIVDRAGDIQIGQDRSRRDQRDDLELGVVVFRREQVAAQLDLRLLPRLHGSGFIQIGSRLCRYAVALREESNGLLRVAEAFEHRFIHRPQRCAAYIVDVIRDDRQRRDPANQEKRADDDGLHAQYVDDPPPPEFAHAHRPSPSRFCTSANLYQKSSTDFLIILAPLRKCRNCLEYQAFPAFCVSEDTPHIMAYRSLIWRSKVVKP